MGMNLSPSRLLSKRWNLFAMLSVSVLMPEISKGTLVGSLVCDQTISVFKREWEQMTMSHLDSKGFAILCIPEVTSVEEHSVWPKSIASICDHIDEIGKGIAESLAGSAHLHSDDPSAESYINRPPNTNHMPAKKRATLCDSGDAGLTLRNFTVDQVEYTSGGSVLNGEGVRLHLAFPKNSQNSLIVALSEVELPVGDYYIRSYRFKARADDKPEDPDQLCTDMGMSMVMYMRGFRMSTKNKMLPCLSYYFGTWVLKDKGHFWGAVWYSFLLALLTQGLSAVRAVVVSHITTTRTKKTLLLILYTVQQFMGYLIMLIAMMYSVELLLAVVVGVAVGNRIFVKGDPPARRRNVRSKKEQLREPLLPSEGNDSVVATIAAL